MEVIAPAALIPAPARGFAIETVIRSGKSLPEPVHLTKRMTVSVSGKLALSNNYDGSILLLSGIE